MRVRGLGRARRLVRQTWNAVIGGAAVLAYHRIGDDGADPWRLRVSPRHFLEHLEVLREGATVIRLRDVGAALAGGARRPVAITFDDGYADNFHQARPMLARFGMPATVFVVAGAIGATREFWWDELEALLLEPGPLPPSLELAIGVRRYRWDVRDGARAGAVHPWRAEVDPPPSARHALYLALHGLLLGLAGDERRHVLDAIARWSGRSASPRPTHRPLTAEEVVSLSDGTLVEIGAHTMTHPDLPALPPAVQRREVIDGRTLLEGMIGRPVAAFAYPHGRYDDETMKIVRESGFACGCSTEGGLVRRRGNPYRMRRVRVMDWDGDEFARRLRRGFA